MFLGTSTGICFLPFKKSNNFNRKFQSISFELPKIKARKERPEMGVWKIMAKNTEIKRLRAENKERKMEMIIEKR